jgi:hypothetical protein
MIISSSYAAFSQTKMIINKYNGTTDSLNLSDIKSIIFRTFSSPVIDTVQFNNLLVTFSIPRSTYGILDTLVATISVYNAGDTTVNFDLPVCYSINWYTVQDSSGAIRLSYSAPQGFPCYSIIGYSILPHQSQQISLLTVMFAIADISGTQSAQGSYLLTVDNKLGIFSLKFIVS